MRQTRRKRRGFNSDHGDVGCVLRCPADRAGGKCSSKTLHYLAGRAICRTLAPPCALAVQHSRSAITLFKFCGSIQKCNRNVIASDRLVTTAITPPQGEN